MGFWFPHHWTDIVPTKQNDDHVHEFTPDFLALQTDRDRALEDYLNNLAGGAPPIFDFPGPVVISVTDLFPIASARTFSKAYLTAVSTGTATIGIYKNGTLVGTTFNMPAATTTTSVALPLTVAAGDYLQASVTASGGGIVGLAVALA